MALGQAIRKAVDALSPFYALRIRTRILLFLLITSAAILVIELAAFVVIHQSDYYFRRIQWAHKQLELISELELLSEHYSEQVGKMVLRGSTQRQDLAVSSAQLSSRLEELDQSTRGEITFVTERGRLAGEMGGLDFVNRLRAIDRDMDRLVVRLVALREAGNHDEARRLFVSELAGKLEDDFESVIKAAAAAKHREVAEAKREATDVMRRVALLVGTCSFVLLVICVLASYLLHRSIAPSVQKLKDGVVALHRGDLTHRIGDIGKDELGLLAEQFDTMAGQLLAVQSNLELQVHERTIALERANQRLQELDKHRVQFLAEISHELRTPLTVLRGEAQVALRERPLSVTMCREALSHIVEQARGMGRLVDDLLFLGRAETDAVRFERERVNLRTLLAETVREAEVLGRAKEVTIEGCIPTAAVIAAGDPKRLKQALMIGLDNAVKYSRPGGTVVASLMNNDGGVEISVRNHGAGIAPEDLPFVFERFYRGHGMAAQSSEGFGLGLPIAKWIIEKHAGSIELTSEPEGVTELRICLPISGQ
jgi:two-component system OmpR family sensor kinase